MGLRWQINNLGKGLKYVPVVLSMARLMLFADGSFANNTGLSSQIGYILTILNEIMLQDNQFQIRGNLIHWSSTKCKRITRSVLASDITASSVAAPLG